MTVRAFEYFASVHGTSGWFGVPIKGGSITLDQGQAPHIEATLTLPLDDWVADDDVLDALDPRNSAEASVEIFTYDGAGNELDYRSYELNIRDREILHADGEVTLSLASDEALLADFKALTDDETPFSLAASLRDVVDYVLGEAIPGASLEADPSVDADVTPFWRLTNLVTNPSYETNANDTAISVNASALSSQTLVSPPPVGGTKALRFTATAAGTSTVYAAGYSTTGAGFKSIRVTPGKAYTASLYAIGSTPRSCRIYLQFRDEGGNALSTTASAVATDGGTGSMVRYNATAVAPASAAVACIIFESSGNSASQFHYIDGVMLTEGTRLVPYFDGSVSPAGYTTGWDGTAQLSASTRVPDIERDPESLVWKAGQSALDFLAPLVQAAGFRLVCDGERKWTLRDETFTAPGSLAIRHGVNLIDGTDRIDREAGIWFDAAVARYTWTDVDGIERSAVDSYALTDPPTRVETFEFTTPFPGPGFAEYVVRRAQQRGREVTATAVSDFRAAAEQPITVVLEGAPIQTGITQSVTFDLETDEMTVNTRTTDTPPLAWVLGAADLTWDDTAAVAWEDVDEWSDL